MSRRRIATTLFLFIGVASVAVTLTMPGRTPSEAPILAAAQEAETPTADSPGIGSLMEIVELKTFDSFEVLWLGENFEALSLTSVHRVIGDSAEGFINMDFVDLAYGVCDAGDGGCPYPLNVQIWPACVRNRASYMLTPTQPYPYEPITVRGVPGGKYDDGLRVELYTGDVTIVIFGDDPDLLLRAADALQPIAGPQRTVLDPPVAGALEGKLSCAGAGP